MTNLSEAAGVPTTSNDQSGKVPAAPVSDQQRQAGKAQPSAGPQNYGQGAASGLGVASDAQLDALDSAISAAIFKAGVYFHVGAVQRIARAQEATSLQASLTKQLGDLKTSREEIVSAAEDRIGLQRGHKSDSAFFKTIMDKHVAKILESQSKMTGDRKAVYSPALDSLKSSAIGKLTSAFANTAAVQASDLDARQKQVDSIDHQCSLLSQAMAILMLQRYTFRCIEQRNSATRLA